MNHAIGLPLFLAMAMSPGYVIAAQAAADPAIARAVANKDRSDADRERDVTSKPAEVLGFLGLRPGMAVLDMNAATGYYSELIARVVGPTGHVIVQNHPGAVEMLGEAALTQRYLNGRLPNATTLIATHNEMRFPPGSLNMVLMSMTYHDTYWYDPKVDWGPVDQHALLKSLLEALAPRGIVGVIDHVAESGTSPNTSAMAVHRIDPEIVKRDFLRAGFVLEAQSDVLRNAHDDHKLSVFDPAIQGRTDRFVLRFRKP